MAESNDAGFRQFGRPKITDPKYEQVDKLKAVKELESLVWWLKADVWGRAYAGEKLRAEQIVEIARKFDGTPEYREDRPGT